MYFNVTLHVCILGFCHRVYCGSDFNTLKKIKAPWGVFLEPHFESVFLRSLLGTKNTLKVLIQITRLSQEREEKTL